MHNHPAKRAHYTITYRSFKDFDENKFFANLQAVPWDLIRVFDDTNDILEVWSDLFMDVADKSIPLNQHRVKLKNQPQWITPDIIDGIKCRDRHKSSGNKNEYRYWRNKVTSLVRKAKQENYGTFTDTNRVKPGSIFKLFQEVGAGKGNQKRSRISSIKTDSDLCTDIPCENKTQLCVKAAEKPAFPQIFCIFLRKLQKSCEIF